MDEIWAILAVRGRDDTGKDPAMETPPLAHFQAIVARAAK